MTNDAISLVQLQVEDKHRTATEEIQREANDIQRNYNDEMASIEYRKNEIEADYKDFMKWYNQESLRVNSEIQKYKIDLEHADRARANEIQDRLAMLEDERVGLERDKVDADVKYKSDMADIARDTMYNDFVINSWRNEIDQQNADTAAAKLEVDRWLGARRLEVEEHTAMANIRQREAASRREQAQRERESKRSTAINLINAATNRADVNSSIKYRSDSITNQQNTLQLEKDKYATSKWQFWVDNLIARPLNNIVYGISRGVTSSIVSKMLGGTNVQTLSKEAAEKILFKD